MTLQMMQVLLPAPILLTAYGRQAKWAEALKPFHIILGSLLLMARSCVREMGLTGCGSYQATLTAQLRMDWLAEQQGNWTEFLMQPPGSDPQFCCTDSSYRFMKSWSIRRVHRGSMKAAPGGVYEENFAKIWCPIAGHPAFGKGAYYHPFGCCCYTTIKEGGGATVSPWLLGCVTFALYLGTLC